MPPLRDTFAGRGGVLHSGAAAPPQPSSGPHIPDDAPPINPEQQEEDAMTLEKLIADYRNRNGPMIDPVLEGAYW